MTRDMKNKKSFIYCIVYTIYKNEQSWWLFCACTRLSCSRKSFANISVSFATIPVLISFAGRPFRSWPTHFLIRIDWRSATKEESTSGNIEALQERKKSSATFEATNHHIESAAKHHVREAKI